ncbi:LPXTG cell wall anchor domain-containing protein [Streptomyces sp. NBC_01803]|uniref:LPXTG cell wall anchor domain-containing protein n=1 Tax=Streptomyces sp. NBC_01803 TaxID=2975946 RepID=UPI002DDAB4A2|nr:LPXTG cell wall anchor domain-containing protein [Streptomyces sp. NBC_01803]WSA45841.1 LPXTG cell wall anchor domain-containing protein [Streptomyces sp. NBC_01803]
MRLRRALPATAVTAAVALTGGLVPGHASAEDACADWSGAGPAPTELTGVPETLVAGEWAEFTLRAANTFDGPVDSLHPFVFVQTTSPGGDYAAWVVATVEWHADGEWIEPGTNGYLAVTGPLAPGEYAEARVRTRVPAGISEEMGWSVVSGVYVNAEGECQLSDWNDYEFDAMPADGDAVTAGEATGGEVVGGMLAPMGAFEELPTAGRLPDSGPSATFPALALAATTAALVALGALLALRRRRRTRA